MRTLVHRRHSLRDPGQAQLNPVGIALAQEVGRRSGPFARVITSPRPRAVETATTMGFRVDEQLASLESLPDPVARFLEREAPANFGDYVRWAGTVHEIRSAAESFAAEWARELARVPEGGTLLMISHGGIIELGAAGALPDVAVGWGAPLAPLEGVRLRLDRGQWVSGDVLRVRT